MIRTALKNPYLVVVMVLMVIVIGLTSISRIANDLLPTFTTPAVQIVCFYPGMPPEVMERDIMSRLQRWSGQSAGIEHQEAKAMQGVCIVKDFFHEGVTNAEAVSQVSMYAMSDMFYLPPGTIPPMVMPFDPTASVPLCLVTVSNPQMNETELYDVAYKNLRNNLQSISGVIAPAVYGGKLRRILCYVDPEKLRAYNLSIMEVHTALRSQNVLIPAGSAKIQSKEFYIYTNAIPEDVQELNDAPIRVTAKGQTIRFSDVGEVKKAFQIQTNKVRVNGRTLVYVPVFRQPGSNTIEIVNKIKVLLEEIRQRVIEEKRADPNLADKIDALEIKLVMDQSIKVRESVQSLWIAGGIGAVMAGLIVWLFLRKLASTAVIVMAIPVSILTSIIGLYFTNNTINAMTLGGLALAVGILIDQAIVVIDNIERHMKLGGKGPLQSAYDGTQEVAIPLFVSTITFVVVFFPIIFLSGLAKFLFTPLALAVFFAVIASYLIAIYFVPVAAAKLMKAGPATPVAQTDQSESSQDRGWLINGYRRLLLASLRKRGLVVLVAVLLFVASLWVMDNTGSELFPPIDSGQFTVYVRAPSGTRIEESEKAIQVIENELVAVMGDPAPDNPVPYLATSPNGTPLTPEQVIKAKANSTCELLISNIGVLMDWPAAYTPNTGPMDSFVLVQLKEGTKASVFDYVRALRKRLNQHPELSKFEFAFDTGGILTAALNMGEPSPVHLQITGYDLDKAHQITDYLRGRIADQKRVPGTRDVRVAQRIDYPMIRVEIDRLAAADRGVTPDDVMKCLVSSTNSSINFDPAFWIDPSNHNHYFLGTQYYEEDINSLDTLRYIPIKSSKSGKPLVYLQDVAKIITNKEGPAVVNHRNITRVTDLFANVDEKFDLGSVVSAIERSILDPKVVVFAKTVIPIDYEDPNGKTLRGQMLKEVPLKTLKALAADPDVRAQPEFAKALDGYLAYPLLFKPVRDSRARVNDYPEWFQNTLSAVGLNQPTKYALDGADFKGFTLDVQGEIRSMRDSFVDFALGLVLATLLVYLVMVAQFRSFVDPFIVLVTVPMGFIGVALILFLTGTRLNIQSFMGIIMMIGIVVEYTIVLLDFANHRLREGATIEEAIVDAAIVRFRPILMTSVTTILALLPMAIGLAGGEADVPLARTIVGGVIAATLLPKFVVPCLYVMIKKRPKQESPEQGWES